MLEVFNIKDKLEYLDEVANLEYLEWASKPNENSKQRIENKINKIINNLDRNNFCKLILLKDDKLIGFISLFDTDGDEKKELTPWYATMYVKEEYRGNNYSKILNDSILKEAKSLGYNRVYLKTTLLLYLNSINSSKSTAPLVSIFTSISFATKDTIKSLTPGCIKGSPPVNVTLGTP